MSLNNLPFVISGDICDWDEQVRKGLENSWKELKVDPKLTEEYQKNNEEKVNEIIWKKIAEKVVSGLKSCDKKVLNSWRHIYNHSLSLQGVNKQLGDTKAVVGQQAIGLAAGVPAAAGVGAVACPLFKLCMKFFIK